MAHLTHIDKIRKLLRLSRSPYSHEAALARSRAMEISIKYGINLSQLCREEGVPEKPPSLEERLAVLEEQLRAEVRRCQQLEAALRSGGHKKPSDDGNVEKLKAEIRNLKIELKKQGEELHDAEKCIRALRNEMQTLRHKNEDRERAIKTLRARPRSWAEITKLQQMLEKERSRSYREIEQLRKELRSTKHAPWPAGLRLSNSWTYQGGEMFDWAVYLTDGEVGCLNKVRRVHYVFPKSFQEPVKEVRDLKSSFRVVGHASESFRIKAFVHMDTSQIIELAHKLVLKKMPSTGATD